MNPNKLTRPPDRCPKPFLNRAPPARAVALDIPENYWLVHLKIGGAPLEEETTRQFGASIILEVPAGQRCKV